MSDCSIGSSIAGGRGLLQEYGGASTHPFFVTSPLAFITRKSRKPIRVKTAQKYWPVMRGSQKKDGTLL
jgi:hypothetical protein